MSNVDGIKGLGRLYASLDGQGAPKSQKVVPEEENKNKDGDAVEVSGGIKSEASDAQQATARKQHLDEVRAKVDSGAYSPDLKKVAASVITDLMQ